MFGPCIHNLETIEKCWELIPISFVRCTNNIVNNETFLFLAILWWWIVTIWVFLTLIWMGKMPLQFVRCTYLMGLLSFSVEYYLDMMGKMTYLFSLSPIWCRIMIIFLVTSSDIFVFNDIYFLFPKFIWWWLMIFYIAKTWWLNLRIFCTVHRYIGDKLLFLLFIALMWWGSMKLLLELALIWLRLITIRVIRLIDNRGNKDKFVFLHCFGES